MCWELCAPVFSILVCMISLHSVHAGGSWLFDTLTSFPPHCLQHVSKWSCCDRIVHRIWKSTANKEERKETHRPHPPLNKNESTTATTTTHKHTYARVHKQQHTHTRTHACTNTHTRTRARMLVHTHTHTHTRTQAHTHTHIHTTRERERARFINTQHYC